jgi:hypothetical protein
MMQGIISPALARVLEVCLVYVIANIFITAIMFLVCYYAIRFDKQIFSYIMGINILSMLALIISMCSVFVALFKEKILAKVYRPRLSIKLMVGIGNADQWQEMPFGSNQYWSHIIVKNSKNSAPAHEVQVAIIEIDKFPNIGTIPLAPCHGTSARCINGITVGQPATFDLCLLCRDGENLLLGPTNGIILPRKKLSSEAGLVITIVAWSREQESSPYRLILDWKEDITHPEFREV